LLLLCNRYLNFSCWDTLSAILVVCIMMDTRWVQWGLDKMMML
jgi:hypothetical protein